jgi:hypothetical protein
MVLIDPEAASARFSMSGMARVRHLYSSVALRSHGLTVKETAFESLPLHVEDVVVGPVPPIVLVVPPDGGLSTKTCNVPACAMSAAGIVATN